MKIARVEAFHQHIKVGPEGSYAAALAAIDIALWDLKGKVLDEAELGKRMIPWTSSADLATASPRS